MEILLRKLGSGIMHMCLAKLKVTRNVSCPPRTLSLMLEADAKSKGSDTPRSKHKCTHTHTHLRRKESKA